MSTETRPSILDAALACIGVRVSAILLQPGEKEENYITSLHNEVVSTTQLYKQAASLLIRAWIQLTAVWIVGLLSSDSCSPYVPESIRVAFQSFSDIRNPGSYTTLDRSRLPQGKVEPSHAPQFNFTEWWNIGEGETMREPFDVRDEVVAGLLHALEKVYAPCFIHRSSN
jgi:hypothetical protein